MVFFSLLFFIKKKLVLKVDIINMVIFVDVNIWLIWVMIFIMDKCKGFNSLSVC